MVELASRVAVVTGASSGLGRRFALELAGAGATVVGIARRRELLDALATELRSRSSRSGTIVCDVADTAAFTDVLGEIASEHGHIDVLVNCAGVGEPPETRAATVPGSLDAFRHVMETNYFAAVAGTLAVLPTMVERRSGIVVNVSSDSGRAPGPGEVVYGPSKAALSAFTEAMAMRVASSGVHLHALYPGWVPTAMGAGAVEAGMKMPPKMVRRSEEQVARLLLARMGTNRVDIDAARIGRMAPVARALFPRLYAKGLQKAAG